MAQLSLIDAFDDCITRISDGNSLEDCLLRYPAYAKQLRPLLEASMALPQVRIPESELLEDQALVWQQITEAMPISSTKRRRSFPFGLLAAVLLLIGLLAATWIFLTRPQLPGEDKVITATVTPTEIPTERPSMSPTAMPTVSLTQSATVSPTATITPSLTSTATTTVTPSTTATLTATPSTTATRKPTLTATITQTSTSTSTPTKTRTPSPTRTPTATFVPGCGAPLTEENAINSVLAIYPNTTIISTNKIIKFGDTLVWEIQTSHNIEVNIDVACGVILTIEQRKTNTNTNSNDNTNNLNANDNVSSTNTNDNNSAANSNSNSNVDDSGGGGGMGSDG